MHSGKGSEEFCGLHRRLRTLVEQQHQTGKVRLLPVSPLQLAREAERTDEFERVVLSLFSLESPDSVGDLELSEAHDPDATEEEQDDASDRREYTKEDWEARKTGFYSELTELLKRSGYYHAVLSGSDDVDKYYSVIAERIPAKNRAITKLYLLDGCEFARDRFDVAGIPVTRMSALELRELGPALAVSNDFFPNESIDSERFSKQWFLRVEEDVWTAYDYAQWAHSIDDFDPSEGMDGVNEISDRPPGVEARRARPREVAAGFTVGKVASRVSFGYLDALLLLSLYNPEFFEITKILVCERGWRRIWFRSMIPRADRRLIAGRAGEARLTYHVGSKKWSDFERYLDVANTGLKNAKASKEARPLIVATRRYLQATFARGNVFPEWEAKSMSIEHPASYGGMTDVREDRSDVLEDAVLNYVFTLEALLTGGDREAIAEKIAISAALLIGRDDLEAMTVRSLLKEAYGWRSDLVHGRDLKISGKIPGDEVNRLRCVCQRVLAVALSLYAEQPAIDLAKLLPELPVSQERQRQIREIRDSVLPLLGDQGSLSDG